MKIRTRRNVAASSLILLVLLSLTAGVGSAQQLQGANAGEMGATAPSLIQIDKTVDQALVEPGHNQAYTVVFTNTGAAATIDSIADVEAVGPQVQVSKEAAPTEVEAGEPVTYTVTFQNEGKADGVLEVISDTLPAGFTFLTMVAGSDIDQPPVGTAGTIVWPGPVTVPAEGAVTLIYKVETAFSGGVTSPTNEVEAVMDGELVGPASAPVKILRQVVFLPMITKNWDPPQFTVEKEAIPTVVSPQAPGAQVVYTVRLRNGGDVQGVLGTIKDTLPAGFTFLNMEASSGVHSNPSGATGTIVWNGPFNVPAHGELTLVYKAQASTTPGTYLNSVTATALVGAPPAAPASAAVTVKPAILFSEDFEDGIDNWTPFTNLKRMKEGQWFWDIGQGVDGSNCYTVWGGADAPTLEEGAHDVATMYLGEEAEEWTDYRLRVKFNVLAGSNAGVWFRGTYQDVDTPGQWMTGYYFVVKPGSDEAELQQLRTEEEPGDEPNPEAWYHVTNPMDLAKASISKDIEKKEWYQITIEVRGPRIKCYVDDELVIDYIDTVGSVFLDGTIGLYGYGPCARNCAVIKYDDIVVEPLD